MNKAAQYRKFQLFSVIEGGEPKKNARDTQYNSNVFYGINDISISKIRAAENFIIASGKVENIPKDGQINMSSLDKDLFFKIFNNQILDEYEIHNKPIQNFEIKNFGTRNYLFSFGLDLVNIAKEGEEERFFLVSDFKVTNISKCLSFDLDYRPEIEKVVNIVYKVENESVFFGQNVGENSTPIENVISFNVSNDISFAALGTDSGLIILISGKPNLIQAQELKVNTMKKASNDPITNVTFLKDMNTKGHSLFFSNKKGVFYYNLDGKNIEPINVKVKNEGGCDVGCLCSKSAGNYFLFASNKDVIELTKNEDDKKESNKWKVIHQWSFEQNIVQVCYLNNYIVASTIINGTNHFSIFDPMNNIFLYYSAFIETLSSIAPDNESIYFLCYNETLHTKKIMRLKEVSNKEKFDIFYKKNFYDTAYEYAKYLHYPEDKLAEINKAYAEMLYAKGDYQKSIEQYIKTITFLEPSAVIQKFYDGAKLDCLIIYLKALRENEKFQKIASTEEMKDYTALLLNCYIKQRKISEFTDLVEQSDEMVVETAIEVAKEQQKKDLAETIAKKSKNIEFVIQLLVESNSDRDQALQEIQKIEDFEKQFKLLCKFGSILVEKLMRLTMDFITKVVTILIEMKQNGNEAVKEEINKKYEQLILSIFSTGGKNRALTEVLVLITEKDRNCPAFIIHKLIEVHLESLHFINLNQVVYTFNNKKIEKKDLTQTILKLIDTFKEIIDKNFILVLFRVNNFTEGIVRVCEILNLHQELISLYTMDDSPIEKVEALEKTISICDNYGFRERRYWEQALSFYLSNQSNFTENYLKILLEKMEKNGLLTPKLLMQIMDKGKKISPETLTPFLINFLKNQKESIVANKVITDSNEQKILKLNNDLKELGSKAKQYTAVKCIVCKDKMRIPFVFFKCGHAFHQSCLSGQIMGDNKIHCFECMKVKNEFNAKIKESAIISKEHDAFLESLSSSNNKIDVIAEYFGKGVFNIEKK